MLVGQTEPPDESDSMVDWSVSQTLSLAELMVLDNSAIPSIMGKARRPRSWSMWVSGLRAPHGVHETDDAPPEPKRPSLLDTVAGLPRRRQTN